MRWAFARVPVWVASAGVVVRKVRAFRGVERGQLGSIRLIFVVVRDRGPAYYGKWRDSTGRQPSSAPDRPEWSPTGTAGKRRRGRVPDGLLEERTAIVALAAITDAHEASHDAEPVDRSPTFADAPERWLTHLEHVEDAKPSTPAGRRATSTTTVQQSIRLVGDAQANDRAESSSIRLGPVRGSASVGPRRPRRGCGGRRWRP